MSKRDHKASEQDWRSNPSHNTRRDYPAKKSANVATVLCWVGVVVGVLVILHVSGTV